MNKSKYNQLVGNRLKKALEALNLTQKSVLAKCAEQGYEITQSSLSKMLSGGSMQPFQVAQVCKILNLNIAEVLSLDENLEVNILKKEDTSAISFVRDMEDPVFRAYQGDYYAYFYDTKGDDHIYEGFFKLQNDPLTHCSMVDFRFKTGQKDVHGNEIEKHYSGPAYCSTKMRTVYAEITSDEISEKCYLIFHYDFIAYQKLECRLALALTVSSGTKRLPTVIRMLLTREKLSGIKLGYLCGQLKFNSSEILISESAYREFLRDLKTPPKFRKYFGSKDVDDETDRFMESVAKINYLSFNESLISDSYLSPEDKIKTICQLRKYSTAAKSNKISESAEEIIHRLLQLPDEKDSEEAPKNKEE